jgi:hypothetical protein
MADEAERSVDVLLITDIHRNSFNAADMMSRLGMDQSECNM